MYTCVCMYIHMYVHVCTYVCSCMYIRMYIHDVYAHTYVCTYIHMYIQLQTENEMNRQIDGPSLANPNVSDSCILSSCTTCLNSSSQVEYGSTCSSSGSSFNIGEQ